MLTIPIQAVDAPAAPTTAPGGVLIIGRSQNVLAETVEILRADGVSAGATNDFANVPALFDATSLSTVVFGGMVPPDTRQALRTALRRANPDVDFIQGLAGIPGLIAAQVKAALAPGDGDTGSVSYDTGSRVLQLSLESPQAIRVVGFWGTSFVPPEPESTSEVLFEEALPPGSHAVPLPPSFPTVASFVVVYAGARPHPFAVGPVPRIDLLPPPT